MNLKQDTIKLIQTIMDILMILHLIIQILLTIHIIQIKTTIHKTHTQKSSTRNQDTIGLKQIATTIAMFMALQIMVLHIGEINQLIIIKTTETMIIIILIITNLLMIGIKGC